MTRQPPVTSHAPPDRIDAIDALRGVAMLWMTVFHFCFDLNQFGHIQQDFYRDPVWTWQRSVIVSLFLLCAGLGQAVAAAQGLSWPRFWRRWAQVAGCALLVTAEHSFDMQLQVLMNRKRSLAKNLLVSSAFTKADYDDLVRGTTVDSGLDR